MGARDLRPHWSFISFIFTYLLLFIWPLPCPLPCPAPPALPWRVKRDPGCAKCKPAMSYQKRPRDQNSVVLCETAPRYQNGPVLCKRVSVIKTSLCCVTTDRAQRFGVTVLCENGQAPETKPVFARRWTGSAIENLFVRPSDCPGRFCRSIKTRNRRVGRTDARTHALSEFIYKIGTRFRIRFSYAMVGSGSMFFFFFSRIQAGSRF